MATESDQRSAHPKRAFALQMQQPVPPATVFDRIAFLVGTASAVWLAIIIALQGFRDWWSLLLFVPVWAILAYIALPRLHKMLSDIYVPDYFFGRTRTGDGLLGDPVNLGVDGSIEQLNAVMTEAGWDRADDITLMSSWKIIVSTLLRKSYPTAPVSSLFLFSRRQDVAYQREVEGSPKQRHHVRFWHCPPGWTLPGGAHADWLGAASYDTDVGLSLFTLQVTHRIDENTDIERDYVVKSASEADASVSVRVLHDFTSGYHARNGGGDRFITDGNLPILNVGSVDAQAHPVRVQKPLSGSLQDTLARGPLTVALGALSVVISIVIGFIGAVTLSQSLSTDPDVIALQDTDPDLVSVLTGSLLALILIGSAIKLFFAVRILRGGAAISRVLMLVVLTLEVLGVAVGYVVGDVPLLFDFTLLGATLSCIALLCYSTDSAGRWSRTKRSQAKAARAALAEQAAPED